MSELFNGDNYRAYNHARRSTFLSMGWNMQGWQVLDVGCGDGYFGDSIFTPEGAILTCADGRPEHIETLKRERPHLAARAQVVDLEHDFPAGKYSMVFAVGLLYHLSNPTDFLRHCAHAAPILFMETVVWNTDADDIQLVQEGDFYDQAVSGTGCRPSPAWLDRTLKEVGYSNVYEPERPDHQDFPLEKKPTTPRVLRVATRYGGLPASWCVNLKEL